MATDPFASAPVADEAQTEIVTTDQPTGHRDPEAVVVTLKGGSGYDAPWIVLRAGSVSEMDGVLNGDLQSLMERVSKAGQYFAGMAPTKSSKPIEPAVSRQAEPTDIPAEHLALRPGSDWVYKAEVKNGRPWWAWFPPRGSNAEKVWLKAPSKR